MFTLQVLLVYVLLPHSRQQCQYPENDQSKLFCANLSLEEIIELHFEGTTAQLHVTNCSETRLPNNFIASTNLVELKLQCDIEFLQTNTLKQLPQLKVLNLNKNKLARLPQGIFSKLTLLEKLLLQENLLRNPAISTFDGLGNLKVLDLSHNKITNINLKVLDKLVNLQELYLRHNGLYLMDDGVFEENVDLRVLDLSFNKIYEISGDIYKYTKLHTLHYAGNKIEAFESLTGFGHLQNFNLSNCKINAIPENSFFNATSIQILDLTGNSLWNHTSDLLKTTTSLRELHLKNCNVKDNWFELVKNKTALNVLNLAENQIEKLHTKHFENLTNIISLDLSGNFLSAFQLNEIPGSVTNLDLSYNKLGFIDLTIVGNSQLEVVDIRCNRFVSIEKKYLEPSASLTRLEIGGNPWKCDCLSALFEYLSEKRVKYDTKYYFDGNKPSCLVIDSKNCSTEQNKSNQYYETFQKAIGQC